jgi:hypothetical protein
MLLKAELIENRSRVVVIRKHLLLSNGQMDE